MLTDRPSTRNGIVDRFRCLPMSRAAVVVGRTASDMLYNLLSVVVMTIAGLVVGWRIHDGIGNALLAFGLLLLFAYLVSWVMAWVGLLVPSPEVVNNASFMVIFPLTFIPNAFAPSENLPHCASSPSGIPCRRSLRPPASCSATSRRGPRAGRLAAPAPGGLHTGLGRDHHRRVRPGGGAALPAREVNGASGGVGTFAVQIAKAFGADVTGVCSTRTWN